ncbi:sulfatase-like hydrolase/transferase [Paenibacillus sp. LMG 31461]|uniref:Sulfatase-like hydrolase/transferase n=1 Tax=Paenibacillus plantarum TaxID=2654975 RepID=A0ABX1X291_9BACL|nr:sulfatase-like hydrolase/transferase [Paenibacillus plantarum]NOU62500.1 sulfatase-like hydrolase/transferase [Paenibacillus plantarum]
MPTTSRKPNVILITTDQQRKDSLGCYGSDFVHTPHLDQLANDSALFERAYCTNPVCTPSRASIYSGKYVSHHGAWNVGTAISEDEVLLPHQFAEYGYRTHHIGKAHFQPYFITPDQSMESKEEGWETHAEQFHGPYYGFQSVELAIGHSLYGMRGHYGLWVKEQSGKTAFDAERKGTMAFGGEAYDWDLPEHLHNSRWTANRACAFIRDQAQEEKEPFFLSIGFQDPHHPHALPVERAKKINTDNIPLPNFEKGELDDKPPHFAAVQTGEWNEDHPLHGKYPMAGQSSDGNDYRLVNDEDALLGKAYYYSMVEMVDEAIGEILASLREAGIDQDTIIVFTSDHGELLGDHGIWMKGPFHYEQLINVPLLVHWPEVIPAARHGAIISLVDIAPTLMSLCGLLTRVRMDGLDASELLKGQLHYVRESALIECIDDQEKLRLKTLVTKQHKLTIYYGAYGIDYGELYDLVIDPHERRNLWNLADYRGIQSELLLKLLHELETIETRRDRIAYA